MSKTGFVVASHRVMLEEQPIGYAYREAPIDAGDSGWRIFSGDESQEYVDDPGNFSFFSISTLLERSPALCAILEFPYPVAFERDAQSGEYREITNDDC